MKNKYFIVTYGCQMNVHESEKIAGMLVAIGYTEASTLEDADVIVFNTCCIRDTAEKRAYGNIGALKSLKRSSPSRIIAVVGCMTQQKGGAEALIKKFPFVDIVLGTHNIDELPVLIQERRRRSVISINSDPSPAIREDIPIYRTSGTNAWINIMYGCNNFCTYCIVPYVRGRERSRVMDDVIADVKTVLSEGYKEITLLGQNVDSYGHDLKDGSSTFAELLRRISLIPGKFRLRFMTSHPKDITKEVIDVMAASPHICHNIHLPIQSGSDAVLKKMNRKYDVKQYLEIVRYLREKMPDVGITSDIMIGFPGETEEDFLSTCAVVKEVRYSNAFTFVYSPRTGTPAAAMPQISPDIKKARITALVKLQNDITKELSKEYIGKTYEVLIEDVNPKYPGTVCGRTDSGRLVTVKGGSELIGKFLPVRITTSRSASLFGEIAHIGGENGENDETEI